MLIMTTHTMTKELPLKNMMNKDVVIATIQGSLLSAESEHSIKALSYMNKGATFASLYTIVQDVQRKQNTIKHIAFFT